MTSTRKRERGKKKTHLQFEDVPNTIDADENKVPGMVVVFVEELDKDVETAGADEHLKGEGRSLVHLTDESCGLQSYLVGVLASRELRHNGDSPHET